MQYLAAHSRNVAAFVIREIATRYGKSPGGYVWALLEPVAFITLMSFLLGSLGRIPVMGSSFPLFYATGYLSFQMFRGMEHYLTPSIKANKSLMQYPRVAPIDIVASRFLLQGMTSVVVSLVLIYCITFTLRHPISVKWFFLLESTFFAWAMAIGISLMNIVLFFHFPIYEKVYNVATKPLLIVSGVFYVPTMLPHPYQDYILWNPVCHIVMLFREGFYGDVASGADRWYLTIFSSALIMTGLSLFTFFPVARLREK